MVLEKNHDDHAKYKQDRGQTEQKLTEVRRIYREKQTSVSSERKKGLMPLFYLRTCTCETKTGIAFTVCFDLRN